MGQFGTFDGICPHRYSKKFDTVEDFLRCGINPQNIFPPWTETYDAINRSRTSSFTIRRGRSPVTFGPKPPKYPPRPQPAGSKPLNILPFYDMMMVKAGAGPGLANSPEQQKERLHEGILGQGWSPATDDDEYECCPRRLPVDFRSVARPHFPASVRSCVVYGL